MDKLEKVIKGFDVCKNLDGSCVGCPYFKDDINFGEDDCLREQLMIDAIELLKEQKEIIDNYHKADTFLAVHGWQWKETTTESSTNPKDGEQE